MYRKFHRVLGTGVVAGLILVGAGCGSTSATSSDADSTSAAVVTSGVGAEAPQDEQFVYGDSELGQFAMLQLPGNEAPPAGHPVVILVHGGFWSEPWDYTLMSPLADDLTTRGYATWNIEFRRVGGHGGYPETFDDVAAAIDELAAAADHHPLDLDRTVLVGHSSGGHLALWALDRPNEVVQPVAAIGLGAIVDLEAFPQSQRLLGGSIEDEPERYATAAPSLDPQRVALVQGENDGIVPRSTLAPAELAGVPITVVAGTDHFDLIDPTQPAWDESVMLIEGFLELGD